MVLCTIPQNPEVGRPVADFMNGNVTRWNEMTRSLVRSNPSKLRLMNLENLQGWNTLQHPAREALGKRRVPDAVEGNGARIEDNQLTGSDQFDWRR